LSLYFKSYAEHVTIKKGHVDATITTHRVQSNKKGGGRREICQSTSKRVGVVSKGGDGEKLTVEV